MTDRGPTPTPQPESTANVDETSENPPPKTPRKRQPKKAATKDNGSAAEALVRATSSSASSAPKAEPIAVGCALHDPDCEAERIHDWERIAQHPASGALKLCARHREWYVAGRRLGP